VIFLRFPFHFVKTIQIQETFGMRSIFLTLAFCFAVCAIPAALAESPSTERPSAENPSTEKPGTAGPEAPEGLLTDLLEDTETVFRNGFPADGITLETLIPSVHQWAEIRTLSPSFSWIVRDSRQNVHQTAWQIQLSSSQSMDPLLFDSGKVESAASSSVFLPEAGKNVLREDGVFYWRVRTWNDGIMSPWSRSKGFRTGKDLQPGEVSRYPIRLAREYPVRTVNVPERAKETFFDFGKAAFGQIALTVSAEKDGEILVRVGERVRDGAVDRKPAGSTRFWEYRVAVQSGMHEYVIKTRRDQRNTSGAAFLMPAYIGEVMPFRYAEVEELDVPVRIEKIERRSAYYHFDESAGEFRSSDERLNAVWDLCRYSIKATTFLGVYVDGDRERIPYEGDALLNQLSHYGVDREYSMARFSWEYLIFHPTWPTEWNLQCCQMAWYDFLYTGDIRGVERLYEELKKKSLIALSEPNGLISTRKGKVTKEFLESIHIHSGPQFRDIVDWPHKGLAGNENAASGETDGFVFEDFNSVVNAYHYFALNSMCRFAAILGKTEDEAFFRERITQVYRAYQETFFDPERGIYRDGGSTDHASLHANIFPLAFGLVPEEHRKSVADFIKSRGMRCSVYGAQFLLDAVFNGGDGAYGLERMTADDLRSWLNMIRVGSTISLEAWDDRYKPNQDWNHAWGAAPANIIPRKLVGVEPLEPGCSRIQVKPQPGNLKSFTAKVPTIRGPVCVEWTLECLKVTVPANVTAEVTVPHSDGTSELREVGSGTHTFPVR